MALARILRHILGQQDMAGLLRRRGVKPDFAAAVWLSLVGLLALMAVGCSDPEPEPVPTPETTPWLFPEQQIELLESSDDRVKILAARNLGKLGAKAADAIPKLEKLGDDDNAKVREAAEQALEKIRTEMAAGQS